MVRSGIGLYEVVRGSTMLFSVVRCYTGGAEWYGMIRCSTGWYGVVPGDTGWYGVVRGSTEWYGVVRSGLWRYRIVRGSTEQSNKSRIGYSVYPTCQWYLAEKEYNIICKTWICFFLI